MNSLFFGFWINAMFLIWFFNIATYLKDKALKELRLKKLLELYEKDILAYCEAVEELCKHLKRNKRKY